LTRLIGDITYLKTGEGWLYLATVIDLATRMVVGWQLATHMRTSLVVEALQMALDARLVRPDAIFHSDRGTQGGFNWSSQHLDRGGVDGQADSVDDGAYWTGADEVAGGTAA
jgi:putative transposase